MPTAKTTKASTNGHRVIDLDAARAARAEIEQKPVQIKFNGETFDLPAECPAAFALLVADGRELDGMNALFEDESTRFFDQKPSLDDVTELIAQIGKVYGIDSGE